MTVSLTSARVVVLFVHNPTFREVDDIFHVRVLLESESARLAADRITPQALDRLEELLQLGASAVQAGDAVPLLQLNSEFHDVIITAAENAVMARLLTALSKQIRWYFATVVVDRATDSWQQHQQIFEALRAHDAETAARLMATHVGETRRLLRDRHKDGDISAPDEGNTAQLRLGDALLLPSGSSSSRKDQNAQHQGHREQ